MTAPAISERGVWVYVEHDDGRALPVAFELLGKARELADASDDTVTAVVLGSDGGALAREAILHGADAAIVADHPLLSPYTTEPHAKALTELVRARRPNVLLLGSTPNGRDLAGRLAVRLRTGLTANATRLDIDPATRVLLSAVPGFGGTILAIIKNERARPQISTVRPGVVPRPDADAERTGPIEPVEVELTKRDVACVVLERDRHASVDLGAATRAIVAGLGAAGQLETVERLAKALDATLGVTRPLVDLGLAGRDRQVGSTGVALRSKLALVVGASGASHFTSGLKDVDTVIAVNKDPDAEIFQHADFCFVADWTRLAPLLLRRLEEPRAVIA